MEPNLSDNVVSALVVFVPTIVGTALFDLLFAVYNRNPKMAMHRVLGLVVCATVLLVSSGFVFFCNAPNPTGAKWIYLLALLLWVVINAEDVKFQPDDVDDVSRELSVDPQVKSR